MDDVVVHDDAAGLHVTALTDLDTAAAQIFKVAVGKAAIAAVPAKPDGVDANVLDLAVLEADVARAVEH